MSKLKAWLPYRIDRSHLTFIRNNKKCDSEHSKYRRKCVSNSHIKFKLTLNMNFKVVLVWLRYDLVCVLDVKLVLNTSNKSLKILVYA